MLYTYYNQSVWGTRRRCFQYKENTFFFLIGKKRTCIKSVVEKAKQVHAKYTIKAQNKRKGKEQKKPSPYYELNQSTKSNIDSVWSLIYTLGQSTKVYIKTYLITWLDCLTSFKALLFLSFQIVHHKYKEATLRDLHFLHTKEPCQPNKFPLIEECKTHFTPKRK